MILTIHQPECFCHLGLIDKISKSDQLVIADSFQVKKNYYDNRNKIRNSQGWQWITIPISSDNHKSFREVKIIHEFNWQNKLLNSIKQNYSKSPYFDKYFPRIQEIITKRYEFLFDYNYDLLCQFLSWFNVETYHVAFTSGLNLESKNGSDKCLEICKKLNATTYLSGISGKDYLDLNKFKEANIDVIFHEFFHPIYSQQYQPFIQGLSAIDLLFMYGDRAKEIIKGRGIGAMEIILSKIDYKNKVILEMFGGNGEGHLQYYTKNVKHLDIWELDKNKCLELMIKYHNYPDDIYVTNCDSLQEIKKECWYNYFDILIIDPPAKMSMSSILPEALKLLKKEGIVIFRNIVKSYNNNPEVKPDLSLEEWDKIISQDYIIKNRYEQPREYYFLDLWLNNFIYYLERR